MARTLSPETLRLVVAVLLSTALAALAWRLVLEPRRARLAETDAELSALDRRVPRAIESHDDPLAPRLGPGGPPAAAAHPTPAPDASPASWLAVVGDLAARHGIALDGFRPMPTAAAHWLDEAAGGDATAADPAAVWQAAVDFGGTYRGVRRFVEALEAESSIAVVELTLSVTARDGDESRLRGSCVVVWLPAADGGAP